MKGKRIPTKLPISFTWDVQKRTVQTTRRFVFWQSSVEHIATESHSLTITENGVQYDSFSIPWADLWSVSCLQAGVIDLKIKKVDHQAKMVGMSDHLRIPIAQPLDIAFVMTAIEQTQKRYFQFPKSSDRQSLYRNCDLLLGQQLVPVGRRDQPRFDRVRKGELCPIRSKCHGPEYRGHSQNHERATIRSRSLRPEHGLGFHQGSPFL